MTIPLVYALHSGNLYGTERMALATAESLRDSYRPYILAPPGPALEVARQQGFETGEITGVRSLLGHVSRILADTSRLAFLATGVAQSLACHGLNLRYRREIAHLHVVHGGTDERLSYGRKRLLNAFPLRFVAVSDFVRTRLSAHHVRSENIEVVENFLSDSRRRSIRRRPRFSEPGARRLAVVSRVDPHKRVDLLLDALGALGQESTLTASVFGTGWQLEELRGRAAEENLPVRFEGFCGEVADRLSDYDLLVHLCPCEPFGIAILEAMAAGLPVLVPDQGGVASLVEPEASGFTFRADDASSLAERLKELAHCPAERLERVVEGGDRLLDGRFSQCARGADYRRLIEGGLS